LACLYVERRARLEIRVGSFSLDFLEGNRKARAFS